MAYRKGYLVELRARDDLKKMGATHVVRSSRSLTPIDLVGIFKDKKEIWLVQVKGYREAPEDGEKLKKEFRELAELAGTYRVRAFVFMKRRGKYSFIEI